LYLINFSGKVRTSKGSLVSEKFKEKQMKSIKKVKIEQPTMTLHELCKEVEDIICKDCIVQPICLDGCEKFRINFGRIFNEKEEEIKLKFSSSSQV
jgi:radical SAM protein with 4Fe4S-binding SPASM domain